MTPDADSTVSTGDVYEEMEPFEPYTAGELAAALAVPARLVRSLLERLAADERIRKKEPEPGRAIWIREPPVEACPDCGREFEGRFLHPVLTSAQYCPRCGAPL